MKYLAFTIACFAALPAVAQDIFSNGVVISDGSTPATDLHVFGSTRLGQLCIGDDCSTTDWTNYDQPELYVSERSVFRSSACFGRGCQLYEADPDSLFFIKSPVPTIRFTDTSTQGYPSRDWDLRVNDPDLGGGFERFSIVDSTAGTVPFTVQAPRPKMRFSSTTSAGSASAPACRSGAFT